VEKIIIAIDIGSQSVKTAIAQEEDGILHILGLGVSQTEGFVNGNVKNMDKLRDSIDLSVREAERIWDGDIDTAYMPIYYSVSGNKISGDNRETDMKFLRNADSATQQGSVTQDDIIWLKKSLEASPLPSGKKMICLHLQCYQVDDNGGIEDPIDLNGQEIKAAGHIVTDSKSHITDLENAIKRTFFDVIDNITSEDIKLTPVYSGFASSLAVLTEEQKETGVALLDIGDSCSDLSVFGHKYPILTWVKENAGSTVTREIKTLLQISGAEAEKIKKEYACANPKKANTKETIEVASHIGGSGLLKLETLASWVYSPTKDLFDNVKNVLDCKFDNTTYKDIISQNGIILTGGGANLCEISSVAMEVLEIYAKIGKPNAVKIEEFPQINEDPAFSTLVGLCIYGLEKFEEARIGRGKRKTINMKIKSTPKQGSGVKKVFNDLWDTVKRIQIS